jgi:hypothetical protein
MTQADDRLPQINVEFNDEMLPEYDFSQFHPGDRGKHAEALRQGYSVIAHHTDGTSTTRQVLPGDSIAK